MIALNTLLAHLTRPEVTEVCLATGQKPAARLGDLVQGIDEERLSGDDLLRILFSAGGSRYVESLGPKPAQWRTRVEGVGPVTVSAAMIGDVIEARFALRDGAAATAGGTPGPNPKPHNRQTAPTMPPARARAPSAPPPKAAPRSTRPRAADGAPSSRRSMALRHGRQGRAAREAADDGGFAPKLPQAFELDDTELTRPSNLPTPPRGTQIPRAALPSGLEVDLDVDVPSVPPGVLANAFHDGPLDDEPRPRPRAPLEGFRDGSAGRDLRSPLLPAADDFRTAVTPRPPAPARMAGEPPSPPARPRTAGAAEITIDETRRSSAPPRTMPEGGYGHDEDRGASARTTPLQGALPAPGASREYPHAFRLSQAPYPIDRPPTPSGRPDPEHRPSRAPGRTTRPFVREPQTAAFRELLRTARELTASDLHLIAGRPPLLRIAGQMVPRGDALNPELVEDLILSRIPRRLEAVLTRDGSCDFAVDEPELGRFRVNVSRQRTGLKASLRLIPLEVPTLAKLGLPEAIGRATHHHQGLIVLTGPMGHGKTTTLAAVVDILNTESSRHVITVEDPIEYIHPIKRAMMSQREVGTHTRSFHSALKAALREDPDVIVIGELRDTETVRIALEASETGHLVLGTMSTPSAAKAIDRMIDLFPPADQQQVRMTLAGGLRLIVSQRLLPDTEGKAMIAAAEVLPGIVPLWNLIRDNRTYQIPSLQQRGKEMGVIRLDDSLRELVRAGRVSPAAAVAAAEAPDELEQSLGIRRATPSHMQRVSGQMQPPQNARPGGVIVPSLGHDGGGPAGSVPKAPEPKGIFDRVFKKGG